ncbi:peptidoglycan-binding domain-containing protein [Chachezhania sediminis]|uniref:peptidoglycan-binding domain-containing protein n=1 Tax=Chachezhania sediminis TaxID=2599291 RepID=UPI001E6588D6|nr:peptidoglycan-binding domain-containing protein [Chachezhania sediminis]
MKFYGAGKKMLVAGVAALSMTATANTASANDAVKIIAGAVAAGAIYCGATGNCKRKTQPQPQPQATTRAAAPRAPQPWSAERQQRAAVQSALNDFGFPVGGADGVYGAKTRSGVSNFQASMGYPVTGTLTPYEQQMLLGAHNSYKTGMHNSTYPGLYQAEGPQGLVRATADPNYYNQRYRNQNGYGNVQPQYAAAQPQQQQPLQNMAGQGAALQGNGAMAPRPTAGQVGGIATGAGALAPLPQIGQVGEVAASMQDHCDFAKLTTQTNGQQIMAANMTDPDQALNEQFCDARTFLMGRVQTILGSARATEDQLVQACGTVQTAMEPVVANLASKDPAAIAAEAKGISASALGLTDPAAAAQYGELCLGLGYRENDADMALAGAMVLMGAGRAPYAEMVGHHLRNGFGAGVNPTAANTWYVAGLDALDSNQPPAVLPSQSIQRAAIIRAAVQADGQQATAMPAASQILPPLNLGGN